MRFTSWAALTAAALVLAACQTNDLKEPPVPLGTFQLGLNVVITDKMQVPGISRDVTPKEMEAAITKAVAARFDYPRYEGDRLLNFGIFVDGYLLAPPGIPLVMSPASVMMVTVNVFDDATGKKLNEGGTRLTVVEKGSPETLIGSGLTQTKEKQLEILAYNVAKRIEGYLLENPDWLGMTEAEAQAALAQSNRSAKRDAAPASLAAPDATLAAPAAQ
jgi:hypothetical protein